MVRVGRLLALAAPVLGARIAVDVNDDEAGVFVETDDKVKSTILPRDSAISAQRWMQYGWAPDGGSPNFLKHKAMLFELEWDVDVQPSRLTSADTVMTNKESLSATESDISGALSVDASYMAFSGALASSINHGSSHTHKQMVTIRRTTVSSASVINNLGSYSLRQRMTSEALSEIRRASADEIVTFLGEFYATQMTLGGVIETKFQQTQTDSDRYSDFAASVDVSAQTGLLDVSASGSTSIESSATQSNMDLHVTTRVQGGETALWLGSGDHLEVQDAWADSLEGGELVYPIGFTLQPIWKMVKKVHRRKGQEVEDLLRARWGQNGLQLDGYDALPVAPASSRPVHPEGIYRIQHQHGLNNLGFLDAFETLSSNGRRVDYALVTRPHQDNPSQFWWLQSVDDEELYTIRQVGGNDGRALLRYVDAYQGPTDFRAVTRPLPTSGLSHNKQWRLKALGDDTFTIQQESNLRYLDTYLDSVNGGPALVTRPNQLYDADWSRAPDNRSQRWKLTALTSSELMQAESLVSLQ